ncbi:MAG: TlpA family protein disulfide reductase, partial [Acidimicrobiales bacterium]
RRPMETFPTDDRAPEPAPRGRRLPRGVWFAVALAIVVLAIAAFQATGSSTSSTASNDPVAIIDPNATEPVNPLLPTGGALVGSPAPSTQMTRFDGSPVSLADYAGKPVVVNFWSATCVPCRTEMPAFEQTHQQYGDRVAFLGIDTQESIEAGRPFATQVGVTYDLASDPKAAMAAAFRTSVLPTTVLIRADGTIARIHSGAASADELQNWIEQDLLS